ncbi:Uncharacterized protein APZ42_007848, partial [Daphnia magna]
MPNLDRPTMVPSAIGARMRHPTSSDPVVSDSRVSPGQSTFTASIRSAQSGRLEALRQSYSLQGFSQPVVELFLAGCRDNTNIAYQSAWKSWCHWCLGRNRNPLSNDLSSVSDFLANLYATGKSYSSINLHRSMLSVTLQSLDGIPVGQHPLIVKLLKGVYNRNPPRPKYDSTWDPNQVIEFMSSLDSDDS